MDFGNKQIAVITNYDESAESKARTKGNKAKAMEEIKNELINASNKAGQVTDSNDETAQG
jgi:hypothetical protein